MMSGRSRWPLLLVVALATTALTSCHGEQGPHYATEFTVVQLDPSSPAPFQLAVQACAGLHNGRLGGSVYVEMEAADTQWLDDLALVPSTVVTADDFLRACVEAFPDCVSYSYADQQELLPSILTAGVALGALPLDVSLPVECGHVAFDAQVEFATNDTPYLATKYVFEHFARRTTGLAMLNPGYDINASDPSNPALTRDMPSALVDFVFAEKLFVVFLVNGCDSTNPEGSLLFDIVNDSHWPTPLGVYGYNSSWLVAGGFLYEAQTLCLNSRNMGAIASETGNLSFFSKRRPPIVDAGALEPIAPESVTYDPTKTYVAFVIGDGDNVRYMMTSRKTWLAQRIADCGNVVNSCAPLTWSISPHLAHLAPDVLEWYYDAVRGTGMDYFILPPSGDLYSYPTSLNAQDQDRFVAATERDARILGVHSTVHWDFTGTWQAAEQVFLPKYARSDGVVRGVVPVDVPYVIFPFTWWSADQFYDILTGADGTPIVLFRQREWRGVDDSDTEFFLGPQNMANELIGYPPGTVAAIYMTSDGGLTLENSFMALVPLLPPNVQLVSVDAAASLALMAQGM